MKVWKRIGPRKFNLYIYIYSMIIGRTNGNSTNTLRATVQYKGRGIWLARLKMSDLITPRVSDVRLYSSRNFSKGRRDIEFKKYVYLGRGIDLGCL